MVSKRRDRPYQAGRSKHWIKVKNRKHPAMKPGEGNCSDVARLWLHQSGTYMKFTDSGGALFA